MADQAKPKADDEKGKSLAMVAALLGLAATGAGIAFHYMGRTTHIYRLATLRVEIDLFPKSTDALLVDGFFATLNRFADVLGVPDQRTFLAIMTFGTLLAVSLFLMKLAEKRLTKANVSGRVKAVLPSWMVEPLGAASVGVLLFVAIPYLLVAMFLVMLVVGIIGQGAGVSAAKQDLRQWAKGCTKATVLSGCVTLTKDDGEQLSRGFVIESSDSHIAMFDVKLCRALTLKREGLRVVGDFPHPSAFRDEREKPKSSEATAPNGGKLADVSADEAKPVCDVDAMVLRQ